MLRVVVAIFAVLIFSIALVRAEEFDFEGLEEVYNASEVAGTCGGNCPGGRCPSCPCGTSRGSTNIESACNAYTWSKSCCRCIIQKESGGNTNAMNYNGNGSFDVGLFQINQVNWGGCNGGSAPCGVQANIKCAVAVYKGRNSWKPWSTCRACGCC